MKGERSKESQKILIVQEESIKEAQIKKKLERLSPKYMWRTDES